MAAFISATCQIKLHLVWHENDINQQSFQRMESVQTLGSVLPCILYAIFGTENITSFLPDLAHHCKWL